MPSPPPTVVVLMAEWTDAYLWNPSPRHDPFADDYLLDPEVLGVSPRLIERMSAWNSRFGVDAPTAAWWDEGLTLAQHLQREFDSRELTVEVLYHDRDGQELSVRSRPRFPRR